MESILPSAQSSASPTFSVLPPLSLPDDLSIPAFLPQGAGRSPGFCGEAAGLVYYQTSKTLNPQVQQSPLIRVDRKATRLKKMRSAVVTSARLHVESQPNGFRKQRAAFITTTYRPEVEWKPRHMSDLVQRMQHWFKRQGHVMRYVWVMELHKSGRPHYHPLVWLPKGLTLPKPDKQGWWPHGSTRIELARNPIAYMAKYASKGADSEFSFPPGARIHGSGGLTGAGLLEARWWKLPAWAREHSQPSDRLRRRIGGGILNPETGEILETPWRVVFKGGQVYIFRVDKLESGSCLETFLTFA